MAKRSRYDDSRPFQPEPGASQSFAGIRPRPIGPAPGVVEHTVKDWDRADLLARYYYNESRLWWRILDANPELMCAIDLLDSSVDEFETAKDTHTGRVMLVPKARE